MKMNENIVKDMRERTYFISANEMLDIRINNNNEYMSNEKKKQRYKNFEKFESKLSEYIQNIDKQYSQELVDINTELSYEFQNFRNNILNNSSDFNNIINKYKKQLGKYADKIKEECTNTKIKCTENIKCKVTKMMNTINIDDSNEIKEFIRKHYWSIDADIEKLYKSLDEKLSMIQENYVMEHNEDGAANEIKNTFSFLGESDFQIKTDMQFETFPKSKTAVKFLSFVPVVGFIATNILLKKIDITDERHLNKWSLKNLEIEIHATDKAKIDAVNENIKKIENYFTDEINKIIEINNTKQKCLDFLKVTISSHDHLLN